MGLEGHKGKKCQQQQQKIPQTKPTKQKKDGMNKGI